MKVSRVVFIFNFGNENCKSVSLITEITCYAFLRKWKWKSLGISTFYIEKSSESEKFYIKSSAQNPAREVSLMVRYLDISYKLLTTISDFLIDSKYQNSKCIPSS